MRLSPKLDKHLLAYAAAASAAGVGLLALAQPADAEIRYTKLHVNITAGGNGYRLELPPGGGIDATLNLSYGRWNTYSKGGVFVTAMGGSSYRRGRSAAVVAEQVGRRTFARALKEGFAINKSAPWQAGGLMASRYSQTKFAGQWANGGKGIDNRYLGIKFSINGQIHYGWARLDVKFSDQRPAIRGLLTGFAWETVPDKGIVAGRTQGQDSSVVNHATLGALAAGAQAVPQRRNQSSASGGQ